MVKKMVVGNRYCKPLNTTGYCVPSDEVKPTAVNAISFTQDKCDTITRYIYSYIDDILIRCNDDLDRYCIIIIGAEDFYRLVRDELTETTSFHTEITVYHSDFLIREAQRQGLSTYRAQVLGFDVHVVPHMRGVAMVPKVLVEVPINRKPFDPDEFYDKCGLPEYKRAKGGNILTFYEGEYDD